MVRQAAVSRRTGETQVELTLVVDGVGAAEVATGVGALDHFLTLFARHGLFDLTVAAQGDLQIDEHHTVEDVAICLGQALGQALGDRRGIRRTAHAVVPMDEALATVAVDIGGRSACVVSGRFTGRAGGTAPIPGDWVIDWRRFFEVDIPPLLNVTRRIDSQLAPMLHRLPHFTNPDPTSLAVRNLKRGATVRLPHGQAVAEAVGATSLTSEQLTSGPEGAVVRHHGFDKTTPLWYYILKEAEVQAGGRHLGEVGSRIVVEVFVGLLEGHRFSFLTKEPDWKPDLPGVGAGNFTMVDLLRFVGDTNPLG